MRETPKRHDIFRKFPDSFPIYMWRSKKIKVRRISGRFFGPKHKSWHLYSTKTIKYCEKLSGRFSTKSGNTGEEHEKRESPAINAGELVSLHEYTKNARWDFLQEIILTDFPEYNVTNQAWRVTRRFFSKEFAFLKLL